MRVIVLPALLALALAGNASDWPGWRGPNRDATVPAGVKVPAALPKELKIVWRIPATDGFASPVVAGGKLYYFDFQSTKETAHCVNAADGKPVWQAFIDDPHKDGFGTGPRCTPLVDGERVYVQSCKGELKCLKASDGTVVWQKNYVKDFGATFIGEKGEAKGASRHGNTGSPLVDGDHLIALAGGPGASVVCLKKDTGDVVWKGEDETPGYAPPIVATIAGVKQYIVFSATSLFALNASDGKLLWRVPCKTRFGRHVTTPLVFGDTVVVSSHTIGLIGVKITKEGNELKAAQVWENKEAAVNFSSPLAYQNHIFGVGQASKVFCANSADGVMVWGQREVVKSAVDRAHASFIAMDKNILILTDTGELVLFAGDTKEYKELGQLQVCGQNWCNPAYAGGKLFVRDDKEILCIDLLP